MGPDAAAPVVHFQHLIRLEVVDGRITQTAKPLLTVLYGSAHAVAGWFGVVSITILAAGLVAALGALLAYRIAGPIAAGFVGAAVAVSPILLRDIALAYAAPWAGMCLVAAGLALVLAALAIGGLVGFTVAPNWLLSREHLDYARKQVQLHENHAIAMTTLRTTLENRNVLPADEPIIYVPRRLRVQTVVDLGLPLSAVGRLGPALVALPQLRAHPDITIYHDRLDDAPDRAWQRIEIDGARVVDGVRLTPLLADPDRGMWVVRVELTRPLR